MNTEHIQNTISHAKQIIDEQLKLIISCADIYELQLDLVTTKSSKKVEDAEVKVMAKVVISDHDRRCCCGR